MSIDLAYVTGNEIVDQTLRNIVGDFEAAFPQRIRSYYVQGSYTDGTKVPSSDLDLVVLFTAFRDETDRAAAHQRAQRWIAASEIELDLELRAEDDIQQGMAPTLKLGSTLLYGKDVRENFPLMPIEEWVRDRMHSSYWRVARLFTRPEIISYPLAYPDAAGEFYGYDRRLVRLRDGRQVPCTRDLIRLTGWAATAWLAYVRGIYVARKSDCHVLYRAHIGDEWSALLEDIYALCRGRWAYLIPDDAVERGQLRALCAQTLGFENAFLVVYTRYLIDELHGTDAAVEAALRVLAIAPYCDAAVIESLEDLARRNDDHLRAVAATVLEKLRRA